MDDVLKAVIEKALKERGEVRVIVCGSRTLLNKKPIHDFLDMLPESLVIIEGGASGADRIAEKYWELYQDEEDDNCKLKHLQFPANWNVHGMSAGPIRNKKMLDEGKPDIVAAFYDEKKTKGTQHMVSIAKQAGVYVYEEIVDASV